MTIFKLAILFCAMAVALAAPEPEQSVEQLQEQVGAYKAKLDSFEAAQAEIRKLSPGLKAQIAKELSAPRTCLSTDKKMCSDAPLEWKEEETELGSTLQQGTRAGKGKKPAASAAVNLAVKCSASYNHMTEWIEITESAVGVEMAVVGTPDGAETVTMNPSGTVTLRGKKGKRRETRLGSTDGKHGGATATVVPAVVHSANEFYTTDEKMCRVTTSSGSVTIGGIQTFDAGVPATASMTISYVKMSVCKQRGVNFRYKGVSSLMPKSKARCADATVARVKATDAAGVALTTGKYLKDRSWAPNDAIATIARRRANGVVTLSSQTSSSRRLLFTAPTASAATAAASPSSPAASAVATEATSFPSCCYSKKSIVQCHVTVGTKPAALCSTNAAATFWSAQVV